MKNKTAQMSILFLSARADRSGGPIYLLNLVEGLGGSTIAHVACPPNEDLSAEFDRVSHRTDLPARAFSVRSALGLIRYVKRNRIDLIHSHGKGAGAYSRLVGALSGTPVIHTYHGLHIGSYQRLVRMAYVGYERVASWLTTQLVCVVESESNTAVELGLASRKKVLTIRTGIKAPNFLPINEGMTFLHYTRFDDQKNFPEMIRMASQIKSTLGSDFRILVIGRGDRAREDQARRATVDAGLGEVFEFLGNVDDPSQLYTRCAAYISTSRWEGLPLTALNAGMAGIPLVLSDIPGHRELYTFPGACALFQLGGDLTAVLEFLRCPRPASVLLKASERLRRDYGFERMIEEHKTLYASAIRRPNA